MHPTTVTMMISVFRGPSVPPFGSLGRLLAVVAIVLDGSSSCFGNFQTDDFHYYFLCCFFYRSHCGEDAVCLPFASKCFPRGKLSVFTSVSAACWCFDNFHSIFPFRAPLTEMTRLLLVGCFLVHSIQPFYFVSLSSCNHVLLWFLANDYYINSGCGKTV